MRENRTFGSVRGRRRNPILSTRLAPGAIKTDILQNAIAAGTYDVSGIEAIHPMNRLGRPEDIANGIFFLASEENSFITGSILSIDGGYNAQ